MENATIGKLISYFSKGDTDVIPYANSLNEVQLEELIGSYEQSCINYQLELAPLIFKILLSIDRLRHRAILVSLDLAQNNILSGINAYLSPCL
jgi:hypothetical protein